MILLARSKINLPTGRFCNLGRATDIYLLLEKEINRSRLPRKAARRGDGVSSRRA